MTAVQLPLADQGISPFREEEIKSWRIDGEKCRRAAKRTLQAVHFKMLFDRSELNLQTTEPIAKYPNNGEHNKSRKQPGRFHRISSGESEDLDLSGGKDDLVPRWRCAGACRSPSTTWPHVLPLESVPPATRSGRATVTMFRHLKCFPRSVIEVIEQLFRCLTSR